MTPARGLPALGLALLIVLAVIAFTPLANVLAAWVSVAPDIGPADAIVVLGGGGEWPGGVLSSTALHRTTQGIVLYKEGRAPLLVFSGAPGRHEPPARAIQQSLARACGVPAEAIVTDDRSLTTRDEARRLGARLRERGVRTILLVSDAHHLVRASRLFERAGFRVRPAPANDRPEPAEGMGGRFELMNRVVQEMLALLYYRAAGWV